MGILEDDGPSKKQYKVDLNELKMSLVTVTDSTREVYKHHVKTIKAMYAPKLTIVGLKSLMSYTSGIILIHKTSLYFTCM